MEWGSPIRVTTCTGVSVRVSVRVSVAVSQINNNEDDDEYGCITNGA